MVIFDSSKHWYKGNLHMHTTNSDGKLAPEAALKLYADAGYDFVAVTDHWKVGEEKNFDGMLVLPGIEYDFTFATQVLHVVALYRKAADGAGLTRDMDYKEIIAHINHVGGFPIAAHPAWSLNTHDFLCSLDGITATEIFNTVSDIPFNGPRGDSSGILDVTFANGKYFNLVASDDSHWYKGEQGRSYIMLQADTLSVSSALEALKAGHFYASQGPRIESLSIEDGHIHVACSPACTISFLSNQYFVADRCTHGKDLTEASHQITREERFIRVEIVDEQGMKAWTSPIVLA